MNDGELRKLAEDFGHNFEWPYEFITDVNRSPAEQQAEAQQKLTDRFVAAIAAQTDAAQRELLERVDAAVGENVNVSQYVSPTENYQRIGRNKLRTEIRQALPELQHLKSQESGKGEI